MQTNPQFFSRHLWSRLALIACLALGILGGAPAIAPRRAVLANPLPPFQEEEVVEGQAEWDVQFPTPTPPAASGVGRDRERKAELQAGLTALEIALQQGPEAVLALRDTLRGAALDLAMRDIVAAHRQLALAAPPQPATPPISEAEELAALQAQAELDAASRARALAHITDPAENNAPASLLQPQTLHPNAPAADRTVGVSCTYATIGAAIAAANPGDTLLIEGGRTFTENLTIPITLTLQGGYDGCASASSERTTVDGNGSGSVVIVNATLSVTLTNLNLTNGNTGGEGGGIRFAYGSGGGLLTLTHVEIYGNSSAWGGGIWIGPNGQVVGTGVDIYSNTASIFGGGVRLYGSSVTFSDSDIHANSAPNGAGVYGTLQDGFVPQLNLPSYADVYDNDALSGDGFGGGVYMREGTVSLADCSDIYYNNAIEGGGAYLITSTLTIDGDCAEIMLNTATGNGGGVYALGSTVNMDRDAELYGNEAGTSGAGSGGGAYLDNSSLWGDKASIYYNTADDHGGGVYATNNSLLDMDLGGYACSGPHCSQLSYNTASSYGGGVYARDGSEVDLRQIFIEDNSAYYGGGIYAYQNPVYLYNVLVASNDATGPGDGLRLSTGASLSGAHNTLAHNDAGGATTGSAIAMAGATLALQNSVIWGHASSIDLAGQTVTCSDVQGGYTGTGNVNVDPLFVDPSAANFHLQSLSPVIDRCATGQTRDFDNEARPITYIRPATPYDMGADEASARVGLNGAPCAYGRIQDAVDAAVSGDTLQAAADTFSETVDIVSNNLAIAGGYDVDCTTYITGTTVVNGDGAGSVFEITNGVVMLRNLGITGGNGSTGGGVNVLPGNSRVTLDNTDVYDNQASYGGGVYVDVGNALTLTNDSDIHHNTALVNGGGARVWGKLVGDETLSDIEHNSAPNGGGVSVPRGTLVLHGSDMADNQATAADSKGGSIHVYDSGVVTMTNNAWIYNGNTAYDGAGIYADDATLYLNDVTIRDDVAANNGGGVYLANGSALYASEVYIGDSGSGTGNEAVLGAGLYVDASTVDFSGHIYNNIASTSGGGVYANDSTINLTNAYVGGTGANEANRIGASGLNGGGLYLTLGTHATLLNTVVSSNTLTNLSNGYGGGLYVRDSSVVTLTNSRIERHVLPSTFDGRGAGIYVYSSTVTLDNSAVLSNTAGTGGGGIRIFEGGVLNILNGSELRNNHTLNGEGGAVAGSSDGAPDINISDSTLQGNSASTDGGAVYLSAGTLDFIGWWNVRDNTASGNGGAIAVTGTGDADFQATGAGSSILYNQAGGDGGALYIHNTDTVQLHSTGGYLLSIGGNQAGGNGGAAFADGGGYFDVYGRVVATANSAGGNGGVFYLTGGSKVWLDDSGNDVPELRENSAQNGGAIYAQDSPRVECDGAMFGDDADGNHATTGSGGAVYLSGSVFSADNCTFRNGQATQNGGAIAAYTSTLNIFASYPALPLAAQPAGIERDLLSPAAPTAEVCNPLTEQCSAFSGNVADSDANNTGDGGAIYTNDSTLQMDHTYLHRNSAYRGGAIYQTGATAAAEVANSLIYSNTVNHPLGAGIRRSGGAFTLTHVTLANNTGGSGFSGVASAVTNTIAWGNSDPGFASTPVITSCNIDDGGNAGLVVDPQFMSPGAGENYRLRGSSPAIDACVAGLTPDLDNTPRPFGSAYDMGAYEYAYGVAFTPDRSGEGLSPSVIVYTHTLTDTGGVADTFTLSASSGNGWSVTLDPATPVMLSSGAATPITVSLSIPVGVLSGTLDTLVITATSASDAYLTASVTDTTSVFTSSLPIYTLTVNVAGNGAVTRSPSQTHYISGTVVQLEAEPDSDWTFIEWSGDLTGSANPADITLNDNAVVTATFAAIPTYTLTVDVVGGGAVTRSPSQTAYLSGTVVQLTAEPDPGWAFVEWSGDLSGSANPDSVTMDDDRLITATFAPSYTLTVNVAGNGSVTRSPSQTAYISGTIVQLTAEPDPGWYFIAWSGDLIVANNPVSLTMDSDKVVTATFSATPPPSYTLTVNVVGSGAVTRSPSQTTYISGTVVQLTAVPDAGWTFIEWSGDLTGSANPVNLKMDSAKAVTATFSLSCVDVSGASFVFAPTEPMVGESVTFTGSVAAGDAPVYAWDFGDSSAVQTGNPIVHTFPSTSTEQTYTVVMTASNSCPSQSAASHLVTVRPRRIYLPLVMRNYSS